MQHSIITESIIIADINVETKKKPKLPSTFITCANTHLYKPPVPSFTAVLSFLLKSLIHLFLVSGVEAIHAFNIAPLDVILFN